MEVTRLIGEYAFPIVACIIMAWYIKYQQDANNSEVKELREHYEVQFDRMIQAINNNTQALTALMNKLGG